MTEPRLGSHRCSIMTRLAAHECLNCCGVDYLNDTFKIPYKTWHIVDFQKNSSFLLPCSGGGSHTTRF